MWKWEQGRREIYVHHWTWEHCLGPWGRFLSHGFPLLPIEFGQIVIPFGLVTRASTRDPSSYFLWKHATLNLPCWSLDQLLRGHITLQRPVLLLKQPGIAVKACALGQSRAHIIRVDCATASLTAFCVDHQKMVPFSMFGVLPAGNVWACHDQGVEFTWIKATHAIWWASSSPGWASALSPAPLKTVWTSWQGDKQKPNCLLSRSRISPARVATKRTV